MSDTLPRCETCAHYIDGKCTSGKLVEPGNAKRTNDELVYSYDKGGDFSPGPEFGCVHHTGVPAMHADMLNKPHSALGAMVGLALLIADDAARAFIEGEALHAEEDGDWLDISQAHLPPLEPDYSYLRARGLLEEHKTRKGWVRLLEDV